MSVITTYLYPKKIICYCYDKTITNLRYRTMYSQTIVVHQGIDNPIIVQVKNQDQKPVNMSTGIIQIDIQNPVSKLTEYSFGMEFLNRAKGIGRFVITREQLETLNQRTYKITLRHLDLEHNIEQPLYIDHNYEVLLDLLVKPAYYADMLPQEDETNDVLTVDSGAMS